MFYNDFKIGNTIRYYIKDINGIKNGKYKDFILTEEILNYIKMYENESNYHNMRVVK